MSDLDDLRFRGDLVLQRARELQERLHLTGSLAKDGGFIRESLGDSPDLIRRPFRVAGHAVELYGMDKLIDDAFSAETVLEPLVKQGPKLGKVSPARLVTDLEHLFATLRVERRRTYGEIFNDLFAGSLVLLVEGSTEALSLPAQGWKNRAVQEPDNEKIIRGPHEGFVEDLLINLSLIRRKIQSSALRVDVRTVGTYAKVSAVSIHLNGVADPKTVDEVKRRLGRIQIDGALDVSYLSELFTDHPLSPFPLVERTERVDKVVSALLDGRVVVMVDGSPGAVIVPAVFLGFFTAPEDSYLMPYTQSAIRILRYVSAAIALGLPGFWVALASIHQELIPGPLLISLARARIGIPFPILVEILILELALDLVHEAGLRLPGQAGQTITVVAALVVGTAAVRAGLVSGPVIIVIATTAIATFNIPSYEMQSALRMLRLPTMFLAAFLGFFGLAWFAMLLIVYLSSLRSFGVAYLSPVAPTRYQGLREVFIRSHRWALSFRPFFAWPNTRRLGKNARPGPERGRGS